MIVLVIAPHADDEILGVGATMARLISEGHKVYVCVASMGYSPLFSEELVNEVLREAHQAHAYLGIEDTIFLKLPASEIEKTPRSEVNDMLSVLIERIIPDIVFIPHNGDMQKDHRLIAEAAMVALRPKTTNAPRAIYAYETLSETGWNIPNAVNVFIPNVYMDVSDHIHIKLETMSFYRSQLYDYPHPRSLQAIEALARYRGSTINVKAAEAFALIRQII